MQNITDDNCNTQRLDKQINVGDKIRFFTVIQVLTPKRFLLKCVCGNERTLKYSALKSCKSCGCIKAKTHGLSNTRLHQIWKSMISRCKHHGHSSYKKYGAKGISVSDEWSNKNDGFINFCQWAINNGYNDKLTIDRIDSNGNYEPNNCRWATYLEQNTHLSKLSTNTSGYVGVSWEKKSRKWQCVISINNKSQRIGTYDTIEEAIEARNRYIDKNHLPHQKNVYKDEHNI